jgi:hypothetical protein
MGALNQRFFANHLPALTDKQTGDSRLAEFYTNIVFKAIKK